MDRYEREEQDARLLRRKIKRWSIIGGLTTLALIIGLLNSPVYIVPEGHVAVVKFTGKAVRMEDPGLRFKLPVFENKIVFEVRQRKNVETLNAATANQLPATAVVSLNWAVNKSAAMDLFIQYGSLEQFENRVLDPRIRSAAKAAISRFRADQLIRERQTVVAEIQKEIINVTQKLPITVSNTQLEDIVLPETYMESILAKEKAREDAAREEHNLARQKLEAQQLVQTADADRDSIKSRADGKAYKIITEAEAEADAIRLINRELAKSPVYVELVRAKAWNGVLPTTILGDGVTPLLSIGSTAIK